MPLTVQNFDARA
jgi:hypothetical protein